MEVHIWLVITALVCEFPHWRQKSRRILREIIMGARISTISDYFKKTAKCRNLINIFYLNTVNVIVSTFLSVLKAESNEIQMRNLIIVLWYFIMYSSFITIVNDRLNSRIMTKAPNLFQNWNCTNIRLCWCLVVLNWSDPIELSGI